MSTPAPIPKLVRETQVDIAEHPAAWKWLREMASGDPEGFMRLIRPNRKAFEAIWGKPHWKKKGEAGETVGWTFRHQGLHWLVSSSPDGTQFRLRIPTERADYMRDQGVGFGAVAFLQELLHTLRAQQGG